MKRYYKDGKVGTLNELFPNTSFPKTGQDAIAKEKGAIPVIENVVLGDYQTADWHDGKKVGDNYQFFTVSGFFTPSFLMDFLIFSNILFCLGCSSHQE